MSEGYRGLMEVAVVLGVPYWRVLYSHKSGQVPWPERIVGVLAYSEDDIGKLRTFFEARAAHRNQRAGRSTL